MRWLKLLSRVAFICNLLFLVAVLIRFQSFISDPTSVSFIGIIGYFMVFILNPLVNISYFFLLVVRKKLSPFVPPWLAWSNFIFLILEAVYIITVLNDVVHTPK